MTEYVPWFIDGGFALAVLVFMWNINSQMVKKTNALFRRFDEHKLHIENKLTKEYVAKDMCHLMHEHGTNDFHRVEKKIDEYHKEMTRRIEKLEEQIVVILKNGKKSG